MLDPLSTADYLALVTSEHRDKPRFTAVLTALVQAFVDTGNQDLGLIEAFDLDTARGVQLDAVGEWIGLSRILNVPLTGVYFTWDDVASDGWESGTWKGPFDPDDGLVSLPDDDYRLMLKAKIAANRWNGTMTQAEAIWAVIFRGTGINVLIQDMQDMSMVVAFTSPPSAVVQALLLSGYFPLKPSGVRIRAFGIPVVEAPVFAWDSQGLATDGWDRGAWIKEVTPTV